LAGAAATTSLAETQAAFAYASAPSPLLELGSSALDKQLGGVDEALLDTLLPVKAGDLQQAKLGPPARGTLYVLDGAPLVFDASGKGDYYVPTVMGLWRAPELLPRVPLRHPAVSQFICGAGHGHGADVMLPGVNVAALPPFAKGALVSVVVPGNPAPIAVGFAALSSEDMAAAFAASGKGKAVEVLQAYGDHLWQEAVGKPVPNEGFLEGVVAPLPGVWDGGAEIGDQGHGSGGDEEGSSGAGSGEAAAEGAAAEGTAVRDAGASLPTAEATTPAAEKAAGVEAAADMDALLEAALLQALHKSVKDADLPLAGSVLW
jgi:translation initiation factor 2D